ncbi:MAG: cytochrome ubiquinol oxidase subunit I, partial [Fimbriimonadaceae bacterium]
MNYPVWDVPGVGGPWVIGIISIFHVLIAWFAVGGGIYLPYAERKLYREGREEWLPVLKKHSRMFLVLTGVFGAVSGVGIWFAIGLVQPEATSTLIHNFVFGWAIEWVFFVIELAAAAVYYYTWDRIPRELHLKVGF